MLNCFTGAAQLRETDNASHGDIAFVLNMRQHFKLQTVEPGWSSSKPIPSLRLLLIRTKRWEQSTGRFPGV
jgi:hypothetical protein